MAAVISGVRHASDTERSPPNAEQASIGLLNARLADGIDLALLITQAHWTIKGRSSLCCMR